MSKLSSSILLMFVCVAGAGLGACDATAGLFSPKSKVNTPREYRREPAAQDLLLDVDARTVLAPINRLIFGSNLEWFNEAGGLAGSNSGLREGIVTQAAEHGASVYRFPGGILADYYQWKDGIGPRSARPTTRHPTDSGSSRHLFGSPEFFEFLRRTGSEGLITVNAGTGSPEEAAAWVDYANKPGHLQRARDGFPAPIGVKLWEVGNELYLPGNPHEQKVGVTPEVYAERFVRFADALRGADPSVTVVAIGVAKSHIGPDSEYPDWTEKLLRRAANKIDMIAVHNAYFPMLYKVREPDVLQVYPALWASPEATDESLRNLDALISRYEGSRRIGVAITEWGALFSLPRADPFWVDHVKTLGSGVYVGRMLQVFMSHPRVQMANYFKLADRSFMGWIDLNGRPKVPHQVFKLYAKNTGDQRLRSVLSGAQTYDAPAIGVMKAQHDVPEVTAVASRDSKTGRVFVNLVNRSMSHVYRLRLSVAGVKAASTGQILSVSANEPTAHNGRDIPPEWPYREEYEPYTTAAPGSIGIQRSTWSVGSPISVPPFSVMTVILDSAP